MKTINQKISKKTLISIFLILFLSATYFTFSISPAGKLNKFASGDTISASEMNENFEILHAKINELASLTSTIVDPEANPVGYVPVGAIIAWHRDFENTPALPNNFLECDGQIIHDTDSPYNGTRLPDLNGQERFLRGSGQPSGTMQEDATAMPNNRFVNGNQNRSHSHSISSTLTSGQYRGRNQDDGGTTHWGAEMYHYSAHDTWSTSNSIRGTVSSSAGNQSASHTHSISGGDGETRPINMSISWIMRIK